MDNIAIFFARDFYIGATLLALALVLIFYRSRLIELVIAAGFVGVLSLLIARVLTTLIASPRPFVVTGTPPMIESHLDNGFPSTHVLIVAIAAAVVSLVNWKVGTLWWVMALLVGLARVYVRVHHLVDIIGSLIIVLVVLGGYLLVNKYWFNFNKVAEKVSIRRNTPAKSVMPKKD